MKKVVRKLAVCFLTLFAFAGSAVAQNDPLVVIKYNNHYLAHDVNNALTDVQAFDPATCLWYSGNTVNVYGLHHNYYFIDGNGNYRFLSAPLQGNGTLSLSATMPSVQLLRNSDQIYYFYNWDQDQYGGGVARGHKHYTGVDPNGCTHSWHWYDVNDHSAGGECWEVYWVEYDAGNGWELTEDSHYSRNPEEDGDDGGVPNAGLYRDVTSTEHPMEVLNEEGGAGALTVEEEMESGEYQDLSISVSNYSYTCIPAYTTYVFEGGTHNYYNNGDQGTNTPGQQSSSGNTVQSYEWTISGDGEYYLSFDETEHYTTSEAISPRLYYNRPNNSGHFTATLTLVLTYENSNGETSTQVRTATILVKAVCGNPEQSADPVVTYEGVTVSWYPTASHYKVYLTTDYTWTEFTEYDEVGDVTSYTFTGLENNTQYYYKIVANCNGSYDFENAYSLDFTTKGEAGLLVYGAVFGGGRMANVSGKTEVAIINCDSIHAVYGGNDIAGVVQGADGATITIGVAANDPNDFDDYGTTNADIRICDVYGGGNGYYAYNGTSFEAASHNTVYHVEPNASILEMTQLHQLGDAVWTNTTGSTADLVCPTIKKAKITVTNDYVKIDSLFGGAKNAILNDGTKDVDITIDGGTIFTVFGGNNFGGSLGYKSEEHIVVNQTKTQTGTAYHNGTLGRDFGIGYLFGGGNKVQGQYVYVTVEGGQLDTIFGGGNEADVRSAQVTVNCQLGALANGAFGKVYSDAINDSYSSGALTNDDISSSYNWDRSGIYNIRTLFGGNNRASMEGVPTLVLTSGGIGTVYGGGNEGDMLAQEETTLAIPNSYGNVPDNTNIKYGTHVQMNSPNILIDYLYGGCQKSNVDYSTWVELNEGRVGIVYGGCNISGDVGSTRVNPSVSSNPPTVQYQEVQGGTYVWASGGTVYKNLFAGSNGFYHCNDGIHYIEGIDYCSPENYVGMAIPTHNETHVIVTGNALIKGNVYAGGNMSPVGFTDATVGDRAFPQFVGLASLRMNGGVVHGNVFGGGNMASILGSNEVMVSGGSIGMSDAFDGALYGGNDRSGQVGQISNRVFPSGYDVASDGYTSLTDVSTYVSLTGTPDINTVYGGGNGYYDYEHGDDVIPEGHYCSYDDVTGEFNDKPIQTNTFVDININGFPENDGGHINTVYGGGDGVTVYGSIQILLNVKGENGALPLAYDHVGTIFGGNNRDNVVEFENAPLVPDIILLHGQVGTVYGGCNKGAMTTGKGFTIGGNTYENVGSMVRLRSTYPANNEAGYVVPTAVVSNAVYGGCRMSDVTYNSLVIVEGGTHPASMFGGSDISGTVGGTSQVVVTGGTIANAIGGGNGDYYYANNNVYPNNDHNNPIATGTAQNPIVKPSTHDSRIDMGGGTADNLYAGGNACNSGATLTNMTGGTVNTGIYGGCNSSGNIDGNVEVNITGGLVGASTSARANVHGGGFGSATETDGDVTINIGATDGEEEPTYSGNAIINGDIYGGSALGEVSASNKLTQVNFYKGTINGDVYGGGLGQAAVGTQGDSGYVPGIAAEVSGDVEVNIYGGEFNDAGGNGNLGYESNAGGRIFGCNNANGSPKGDVRVNIYATDHGVDPENNLYPTLPEGQSWDLDKLAANTNLPQAYAIKAVFGGGNLAAYVPDEVTSGDPPHSATVHVYNCNNTIKDVFGGGNSADVGTGVVSTFEVTRRANTYVIIDGGRFHRVIGGGNGEDLLNPAANIYGTANTTVYAGLIDEVYGGANMQGSVDGINLVMDHSGACDAEVYGAVFGCANAADYNRSVTTTIKCGVGTIGQLYGGSNQAFIGVEGSETHADVTLNVYGGTHDKVFAGSKGIAGSSGVPAHIYGDVTLNLYGGTITHAFGGSDANGNISGTITVNVLDMEVCHPLDVTNVYGASNQTPYNPDNVIINEVSQKPVSPVVNVIHIKNEHDNVIYGIRNNVYGGGNLAPVTSNPQVNIGYHSSMSSQIPTGYPIDEADRHAYVKNNVYGGGNEAGVTGDPVINMRAQGTVVSGIYGGCNTNGTVTGDINVNIYGGTLGTSSSRMIEGIFGGGKGHPTGTTGDITVTVDDNETNHNIYADVYGGSALGQVGAAGKTALVDFKNGTLYGTIYGGGMGEGTTSATAATVTGNTEIAISGGTVIDGLYGGCNVNGIVEGSTTIGITNGTIGESSNANRGIVYGGGLGQYTKVKGDVAITVNGASVNSVNVYGDVYGGSAKGLVNCNDDGNGATAGSTTSVTLTNGTIHGDLYGGGHGLDNQPAHVYGPVTVTVNGSAEVDDVFGCNNQNGAPQNSVMVNIINGKVNSVFGGGNVAAYTYTTDQYPNVNISGGEVTHKVVGGGNAANVTGNPLIQISGGRLCTEETGVGAGVYGGCYATGIVDGNITINITNADGNTVIGTMEALEAENPVSVHGGGYGSGTSTTGNVLVNFGTDTDDTHSDYPKLNGDLYGGSALGNVNSGAEDQTIVNIMNGSFGHVEHTVGNFIDQFGGNIYGGGLGQQEIPDDTSTPENEYQPGIAAKVWGVVHVNIGAAPEGSSTTPTGQASLVGCNVYGCNNLNGSPQQDVFVDVYQTTHITTDYYDYTDEHTRTYAIKNVFGGGNRSHYHPDQNTGWTKRTHNYIHYCENTVEIVYAAGNASDCDGVWLTVDGGRFDFVFGGGNGQRIAANVGEGSTIIYLRGGLIGWYFVGCNLHGTIGGTIEEHQGCDPTEENCCEVFKVEKYYFGANEATIYEGITNTIDCAQASFYNFRYVYAGSRLAVVYGDIKLTVQGGTIGNLFGGSEGSADISADVRKYPVSMADIVNFPAEHQQGLTDHLTLHPEDLGGGGNIILTINGGTIGNVFGGNDFRGNVEGTITVTIDSIPGDCPLDINYVYGGNNKARYEPHSGAGGAFPDSPCVTVKNGHVNGAVYGGSKGGDPNHPYGNGEILNANPQVVIGDNVPGNKVKIGGVLHSITPTTMGEGDVYGGGRDANITGNPTVTLQGKVVEGKPTTTIEGNVFGGAKSGNVTGNTNVIIVPTSTP